MSWGLPSGNFLLVSHGISSPSTSWAIRIREGEHLGANGAPYDRIMFMHLAIMALGFLISLTGAPEIALVVLVFVKIAIDAAQHLRIHGRGPTETLWQAKMLVAGGSDCV